MKKHNDIEQGTSEWHHIRKGKITGTTLNAIMSSRKDVREDAMYEIIGERLTVGAENGDYESPIDRGHRLEPEAVSAFEFETGKSVERTGFCENDENSSIAYSPDGIISDEEDLEVKCMEGKGHTKMWLKNEIPDKYYWQLIQAFVVNPKLQKRNFVGYNPDIPTHPLHIIEVTREQVADDIEKAKDNQEEFLKEVETKLSTIITLE